MTSSIIAFPQAAEGHRRAGGCRVVMATGSGTRLCLGLKASAPAQAAAATNVATVPGREQADVGR